MNRLARAGAAALVGTVRVYQYTFSAVLGGRCRFHPTCSEYAIEALTTHGPVRGTLLAARRFARCHPLGGSGVDLVPPPAPPAPHSPPSAPANGR